MKKKDSFFDKVKSFGKKYVLTSAMLFSSMSFTTKEASQIDNKELKSENINTLENNVEKIAKAIVESGENILGNFSLENYKFSKEDLQKLQASDLGSQIAQVAKKVSKKTPPAKGVQTYCLSATRTIYSKVGVELDAHKYAYNAVEGFRKNDNFIEVNCDRKDFVDLVDGTGLVWEKGKTGKYGHVAIVVSEKNGNGSEIKKQYCDRVYNLNEYDKIGQYGKARAFLLKSTIADFELVKKFVEKGLLKDDRIYDSGKDFIKEQKISENIKMVGNLREKLLAKSILPKDVEYTNNDNKFTENGFDKVSQFVELQKKSSSRT